MMLSLVGRFINLTTRGISTSFYDAVIVGGGMVGNAMACNVGSNELLKDKKFLLLESAAPKPLVKSSVYSNRTSAIIPASIEFLKINCQEKLYRGNLEIGVWERFLDYRAKRVDRYEVIDSSSHSTINFGYPAAVKEVAYIIENNIIVSHLLSHIMEACKNVTVKTNVKVVQCRIPDTLLEDALLVLDDGTEVETSLVIGADGGSSVVRKAFSPKYTSWKYGQKGVVAVVEIEDVTERPNNFAWQRFSCRGPVALLPLSNRYSNLIWTTSDAHAEQLLLSEPEEFIDMLNDALFTEKHQNSATNKTLNLAAKVFGAMFNIEKTRMPIPPRVTGLQPGSRASFPLVFGHSHTYVSTRAALIGDAAHRIHPLGGLGVNLGWSDVRKLTASLEKCVSDGGDPGALTYLSQFDTDAQRHNVVQQIACDFINRLYRTNCFPAVFLRSLGLYAVNSTPWAKSVIMESMSRA